VYYLRGKKGKSTAYCKKHLKQRVIITRKRQGSKPWEAGLDEFLSDSDLV
jgi:hypothetical protein